MRQLQPRGTQVIEVAAALPDVGPTLAAAGLARAPLEGEPGPVRVGFVGRMVEGMAAFLCSPILPETALGRVCWGRPTTPSAILRHDPTHSGPGVKCQLRVRLNHLRHVARVTRLHGPDRQFRKIRVRGLDSPVIW